MPSANDPFKPDKIIKAKKGESSWKVAANERTRIMLPQFIDLVRWEGVGWPRVIAPGAVVTVVVDGVNFGQGSGVDITVSDSEGNFEETVHCTVHNFTAKLQFQVPYKARKLLLVKVEVPKADRPDWDAGLEEGDLEQMAPAIKIVPSLLQQVRFDKEAVTEGEEVTMTVQTSRDKDRYRGRFEVGRLERYGGKDVFIRHAGPFYKYPEKAGGYEVTWTVTTPMIDRSEILAQWQIDKAKTQAEETGETYSGPGEYRGIELIARANHLGLQSDSTGASRTGPDWTGTLTVLDDLVVQAQHPNGAPAADQRYEVTLADGSTKTGTLDAEGRAKFERVPPGPARFVCLNSDGTVFSQSVVVSR